MYLITNLDAGTLVVGRQLAVLIEHGHVHAVAVRVGNENVAAARYVDAIGKVGNALAAKLAQQLARIGEHRHAVAFEVANVVVAIVEGHVRRLLHVCRAVEPRFQIARLADDEARRLDTVNQHDLALCVCVCFFDISEVRS